MIRLTDSAPAASSVRGDASSSQRGAETLKVYCKGELVEAQRWGKTHALCKCGALIKVVA